MCDAMEALTNGVLPLLRCYSTLKHTKELL